MPSRTHVLALAIVAALPSLASAVDFSYNGFSTAAYSQTDTDKAQVGYAGQPDTIDSGGSFTSDSKVGLQVTARFDDRFSATVQGVAYADLTSQWEPHLDWAYVRARLTPDLSARAGLLRTPLFMFSDSIFIGYSNVWLRAPLEIYNQSPVFQLRGIDLSWRRGVGPVTLGLQPYFGESSVDVGTQNNPGEPITDTTLHAKRWAGTVATAEYKSLTARAGYSQMEIATDLPAMQPLVDGLNSVPADFCPDCAAVAAGIRLKGTRFRYMTFGGQYDDGTNVAIAEYAKRRDNHAFIGADMHGAYVTYGRRFGNFMPYFTTAIHRVDSPLSTDKVPSVGPLAPLAAGVAAAMNNSTDQDSYSFGIRYELPSFSVVNGALLKLQFDHIDTDGGPGNLNFIMPGYDGTVNMLGLSADFVF